jgi:hypothetical protein
MTQSTPAVDYQNPGTMSGFFVFADTLPTAEGPMPTPLPTGADSRGAMHW